MATIAARITMPETAKKGEIIEIRLLVRHPMERGIDAQGAVSVRRQILHTFRVRYAGEEVFHMDLSTGIAANPYIAFTTTAVETGEITFEWVEDGGAVYQRSAMLTVT
ncbi:MAG: thiosulfate oxidation carrier complex protein SoxZ [Alphaproteobacteria bacterium]